MLTILLFTAPLLLHAGPPPTNESLIDQLPACEELQKCASTVELLKRGKRAVPAIIKGLKHENELARFWSCGLLSEIKPKEGFAPLVNALNDPKIRVKAGALFALGSYGDKRATPHLLRALTHDDVNLRIAAAIGLGTLADPAAFNGLIAALKDKDDEVRGFAIMALADIGDRRAEAALILRLQQDIKPRVRALACAALGALKGRISLTPMISAMNADLNPDVRVECAGALAELGNKKAIPALQKATSQKEPLRSAAIRALRRLQKK